MENMENPDSPIDFERLREVCGGDAEMMEEIVELYFSQTAEQMIELKKAIYAQNFDAVFKSAHKIAGSSLTCGMNAIVPSIRELEQYGRNRIGENAEQLFEAAHQAFEQMKTSLEKSREELFG